MATLQRPTALCPASSRARVTMPTGLVKSTIQAFGARLATRSVREVEDDRHGAQRLGQPARAGGLLTDAAAVVREGLVDVPGGLAADAELEEDGVGAVDALVRVGGGGDLRGAALAGQDAAGERGDDVEPIRVGVDQGDLGDGQAQPGESVDEFGGVRGSATDNGDLQPLTPVSVTPSMKAFCAKKKTMITGAIAMRVAAMVRFHCTAWEVLKVARPRARVQWAGVSPV